MQQPSFIFKQAPVTVMQAFGMGIEGIMYRYSIYKRTDNAVQSVHLGVDKDISVLCKKKA